MKLVGMIVSLPIAGLIINLDIQGFQIFEQINLMNHRNQ